MNKAGAFRNEAGAWPFFPMVDSSLMGTQALATPEQ